MLVYTIIASILNSADSILSYQYQIDMYSFRVFNSWIKLKSKRSSLMKVMACIVEHPNLCKLMRFQLINYTMLPFFFLWLLMTAILNKLLNSLLGCSLVSSRQTECLPAPLLLHLKVFNCLNSWMIAYSTGKQPLSLQIPIKTAVTELRKHKLQLYFMQLSMTVIFLNYIAL